MKHLFRIVLSVAVVAAMTLACKKTQPEQPTPQPEPKKDTTFVLEATVSGEAKYDGSGDLSYTVKSIRKIDKKEEFMPWTMEFSMDGGNTWKAEKPEFLTLTTTKEENGDLTAKSYTAKFAAQEKTLQTSDIILKGRDVKTNVDLSTVDIKGNALTNGQSTANCYVIHNPGTYKFPTVYGNAKKNGATNAAAYTSTKSGYNILTKFLGANGEITKPEIDNIANACLIWQDTQDLISNISFDSANQYVKFEVNKATIHNGNAIIAVRDNSNTILWSWHIWVTEEDLTPIEITNHGGYKYNILPVNLGWCGLGADLYAEREVKVRLKQEGGKTSEIISFKQKEYKDTESNIKNGNNPYYQWGRKDPMLPSNGINNTDKEYFTNEDQYAFQKTDFDTDDIKEYIKNPHKFNFNDGKMDKRYSNLWNVNNDEVVVKTVYDPSPVGFTLPASNAFTGFTNTGGNTINSSAFNVEGGFDKGWYFYRKPNKKGGTIFFPASGRRHLATASLELVTTYGRYWVAGQGDGFSGLFMSFYSGHIYPQEYIYRSYGHSVRPAQEQ